MRKQQHIEQELLKLSPSEKKQLLAWIDRYLEEEKQPQATFHPAIQQGKSHLSKPSVRAIQP